MLLGCAAPVYYYSPTQAPSMDFFNKMVKTANPAVASLDSVQIFQATLQEDYVERNSVAEKTIINTESDATRFPVPVIDKEYRLYIFKLFYGKVKSDAIFMSTAYKGDCDGDNCANVGIGPAYYGKIRMEQLVLNKAMKMTKNKNEYVPVKASPDSIRMIAAEDFSKPQTTTINIKHLVVLKPNKVGGSKPLRYDIEQLFDDKKALLFTYQGTVLRNP